MRRALLWIAIGTLSAGLLLVTFMIVSIRNGLQRFSDDAVNRFPGGRTAALVRVVDCAACAMEDRNHAVWALGQMAEQDALPTLEKHADGKPCDHSARLCQYELGKAIRNIQASQHRTSMAWRLTAPLHQPWH